jgi:outer membrane biosynthesis protein TonB
MLMVYSVDTENITTRGLSFGALLEVIFIAFMILLAFKESLIMNIFYKIFKIPENAEVILEVKEPEVVEEPTEIVEEPVETVEEPIEDEVVKEAEEQEEIVEESTEETEPEEIHEEEKESEPLEEEKPKE